MGIASIRTSTHRANSEPLVERAAQRSRTCNNARTHAIASSVCRLLGSPVRHALTHLGPDGRRDGPAP